MAQRLYMDGPELVKFSLDVVPPLVEQVLTSAKWSRDDVDLYLMHQATVFMLDHLRERLSVDREHTPEALEQYGNTVSSTNPDPDPRSPPIRPAEARQATLLIGFGVGLSWAGCVWTETWSARQCQPAHQTAEPAVAEASAESADEDEADAAGDAEESDKCLEAA